VSMRAASPLSVRGSKEPAKLRNGNSDGRADRGVEFLARPWHTAILVLVMVAVAVTGTLLSLGTTVAHPRTDQGSRIASIYVPMLAVQWGLLVYVCRVGRPHSALFFLLGQRWATVRRAITDITLAASACALIEASEYLFMRLHDGARSTAVVRILPDGGSERLAWVLVAVSVGFCEEVVYRGYLQVQLTAFTRSATVAVVLQAILFGMAHGEQGLGPALRVSVYGLVLGLLAAWRGSLLPGILCHVAIDLASGLIGSG
jgi:membrane protease YdiL (CAAX protease family)